MTTTAKTTETCTNKLALRRAERACWFFEKTALSPPHKTTPRPPRSSVHSSSSVQGAILVRLFIAAISFGFLLAVPLPAYPQIHGAPGGTSPGALETHGPPTIEELRFTGLRRIAP